MHQNNFYKAPQTWAALIMSSRLLKELTILSCYSPWLYCARCVWDKATASTCPLLVRIRWHNRLRQQEEDSVKSLYFRKGLVSLASLLNCMACANATPTFHLQDQKTDDLPHRIIQIPECSYNAWSLNILLLKKEWLGINSQFGSILQNHVNSSYNEGQNYWLTSHFWDEQHI